MLARAQLRSASWLLVATLLPVACNGSSDLKNDIAVVIVTLFLGLLVVARIITSAMMVDESVAETVISRQQAIEIAQDYAKKRGMHVGEATKVWLEKKKMMGDGLNWRVQMLWQGGYGPVSLITVDATTGDVVDARGSRR